MKKLLALMLVVLGAFAAQNTTKSDWRYPLLLITSLPKMVFRYFV